MNNLEIYEQVREVPKTAQKAIKGGRLNGMTDINPMWRIKRLTEVFGPCGLGWKYEITNKWIETAMAADEITANVEIKLFVKYGEEWSEPIPGIGGSKLVSSERSGLYVNDECFKMALTDAISVACKALGVGADIYWENDNTKHNDKKKEPAPEEPTTEKKSETAKGETGRFWRDKVFNYCESHNIDKKELATDYKLNADTTETRFREVYNHLIGGQNAGRN